MHDNTECCEWMQGHLQIFQTNNQDWICQVKVVQLSATRCHGIPMLWVCLLSSAATILCIASQWVSNVVHAKCNLQLYHGWFEGAKHLPYILVQTYEKQH